jgi:hypothetical protein
MKELEIHEQSEQIDHYMYRYNFRGNCLSLCIGRCCAKRFRKVRMAQVANRLKKYVELENDMIPEKPVDFLQYI